MRQQPQARRSALQTHIFFAQARKSFDLSSFLLLLASIFYIVLIGFTQLNEK